LVRISEVDTKGRSRNVSDGYRRLADATDSVRLELDPIAHRFRAGSRIRVVIAGGSHPRYTRNLGTGEATATGSQLKASTHEVHFGASRVVLPVQSA
jgi:predicted acyl esterase